ncbi:MAG: LysR family transcriptional regulator [Hyphomicrobiaceae bacterium]|nr:LysR family transcriptional regulator [Hyphomicrobiaceae bacterium]
MPNLRQLQYLVALSETLHFRRAAERTNTTQPTLSEQLKALEERLGVQLVERSRSHVAITPVGRQVVEIARRMLADAAEIQALANSGGTELTGVVRLGLPPTIGPYLLPSVIPALREQFPDLKLYVREELPGNLPRAIEDGSFDLIISLLPISSASLSAEPLFREPLALAVSAEHPLAAATEVRRADLAGEQILALGPGHQLHDAVASICEDFGADLRSDYEGTSLDTLREMVAMGMGVTFLPGLYVRAVASKDPNIRTIGLADRSLHRSVALIWRRSSPMQASYKILADLLRTEVRKHFPDCIVQSSRGNER